MDLCNPKEIKALLGRHGFRFSKQMGQNFLIQEWVPRQTAEASGAAPGVGVLEIGPGIGPLTAQLARRGEKVVSVELDRTLLPILAETLSDYDNVEIVPGDILKTDIAALCRERMPGPAGGGLCQPALQYHNPGDHSLAPGPMLSGGDGDDPAGGGTADLCPAWNAGIRGLHPSLPVLRRLRAAV